MYKLSKFNYFCKNNNNELLMFNSFIGTRSFCKISNKYKEKINKLDLSEEILNELYEKGIIVDRELDEDQRLYSAYLRLKKPFTFISNNQPYRTLQFSMYLLL